MRQSERLDVYAAALDDLWQRGLLYECTCTRADIAAATAAPQEGAPLLGPDGVIYPGTCRRRRHPGTTGTRPTGAALRLNMAEALRITGHSSARSAPLVFEEACHPEHRGSVRTTGPDLLRDVGDIVLARRDMGTSYHLSVVLDDAAQGITDVVRGADLFEATVIHVVLQNLLGLPTPVYHHHRLIRDDTGKRLAKRDDARAIALYRARRGHAAGYSNDDRALARATLGAHPPASPRCKNNCAARCGRQVPPVRPASRCNRGRNPPASPSSVCT